jgi:nucleotide-binding universal stress UspA family protein
MLLHRPGRVIATPSGMSFKKILCPTDFSPGSQQALNVAARLAKEADAELVIVHSCFIPASMYALDRPFPADLVNKLTDDAQRGLDLAVADVTMAGVKHVSAKLVSGVPWTEIVGQLEKHGFDLCVIGTHGRTGLARVLLGSVAEKVVRHAPCAVLAVRPDAEVKPFAHALVPTDFSETAANAIDVAKTVVPPGGAITLVHVTELPIAYSGDTSMAELAITLDKDAVDVLEQTAARLRSSTDLRASTCSRIGYPGAEILAMIDEDRSIDLVVMGSRGRTGIKRALLGSIAEKVVRHARCPVLVARKQP